MQFPTRRAGVQERAAAVGLNRTTGLAETCRRLRRALVARAVHQVFDSSVVPAPEGGAVLVTFCFCDRRVAILIAILYVGFAMIFEVPSSSFDSVVEAATADFVIVAWRHVPSLCGIVVVRFLGDKRVWCTDRDS